MDNFNKANSNLSADGKQDDGERLEFSLPVDATIHGRTVRSPQPPKATYGSSLRPAIATRPIAPAPMQTVTALNLPSTLSTSQPFITKPVVRLNTTDLPVISGVPTSLTVCHPTAPMPAMTVPVSSGPMASIIRTTHPLPTAGAINTTHIPHATITASYSTHVPRGAAAVASITSPRAAIATPIVRPPHSQTVSPLVSSSVHPQIQVVASNGARKPISAPSAHSLPLKLYCGQPRTAAAAIRTLTPAGPKVVAQYGGVTTSPGVVSTESGGLGKPAGSVATIQVASATTTHVRPNNEPQLIRPAGTLTKPVHLSQSVVSSLQPLPEKGYYKSHLNTTINLPSSVVVPVQQQQPPSMTPCIQTLPTAPATIVTAPGVHSGSASGLVTSNSPRLPLTQASHVSIASQQLVSLSSQSPLAVSQTPPPMAVSKIISQTLHTVAAIPSQQQQQQTQQIVTVPATSKPTHGPPHTSTHCVTQSIPRLTTTTSIPVAKVHPQPLPVPARSTMDATSSDNGNSGTLNLIMPSHHPPTTQQPPPVAGTVGTMPASVVLMETSQERPGVAQTGPYTLSATYFYESYPNSITMPQYPGQPSTFSALPASSTIRSGLVSSHPNANLSAAVQTASRSASVSPLMVTVEPGRPLTLHTSYPSGVEGTVTTSEPAIANTVPSSIYNVPVIASGGNYTGAVQTLSCNSNVNVNTAPVSSSSSSPRPSILRKRTSDGLSVFRKNIQSGLQIAEPISPRPDSSSNSTTLSSTATSPKPPVMCEPLRDNGFLPYTHQQDGNEKNNVIPSIVIKTEAPEVSENGSTSNLISNGVTVETSPRKKPRKQQFTGNELLEAHSTDGEDDFEKDGGGAGGSGSNTKGSVMNETLVKKEIVREDEDGVRWVTNRPRPPITLLNSYRHTWKSRHNHFLHYSDVKPKERRPTISDLANQKGLLQKVKGWKIHHLSDQLSEVVDQESYVHKRLGEFLSRVEETTFNSSDAEDRETNRVSELIKGNLQRCRIIHEQMKDARQQMLKIVDHKDEIVDVINRHLLIKRTSRKREKY